MQVQATMVILNSINNKKIILNKGNALIVRPSDKHKFIDSKAPINHFNIKITQESLVEMANTYNENLFNFLLNHKDPIVLNLSSFEYNTIYKNIQSVIFNNSESNTSLHLRSSIHLFLNNFIESIYIPLNTEKRYSILVQQIIEILSVWQNFSRPLNELLKSFNFSYMQLYRIFKKETGCTLNDYFLYSKMIYASTLLLSSPDPIVSIAQTIGYATQSHFGKAFKEYFGLTPTEYRKNNVSLPPVQGKAIPTPLTFDIKNNL